MLQCLCVTVMPSNYCYKITLENNYGKSLFYRAPTNIGYVN